MRSKYSFYTLALSWASILLLSILLLHFFYEEVTDVPYLQIDGLLILFPFFGLILLVLCGIWFYIRRIRIDKQQVNISHVFGFFSSTFQNNDITSYALYHTTTKYGHSKELFLFLRKGKRIRLASVVYTNFEEISSGLTQGKPNITRTYKEGRRKKGWTLFGLCILILFFAVCYFYTAYSTEDKVYKVKTVNVTLSDSPEESGKNNSRQINFHFKEYPDLYFLIAPFEYDSTAVEDLIKYVKPGDTIQISVAERIFNIKMARTAEPDFVEKHFEWKEVRIYGVSDNEWIYLDEPKNIQEPDVVEYSVIGFSIEITVLLYLLFVNLYPEMIHDVENRG